MKNTNKLIITSLISLFAIILVGLNFVSANTLVGGTIYDGSPDNPVSGAEITVQCDSLYLDTTSLSDGTYAVVFDKESCSIINSEAKDESYSTMKLTVYIQDDTDEEEDNSDKPSTGSTKRTNSVYLCGNGICNTGESSNTCLRDCPLPEETIQPLSVSENNTQEKEIITLEQNSDVSGNPGVTGAVTGTNDKSNTWAIVTIGLLLLVMIFFIIRQLHKNTDVSSFE